MNIDWYENRNELREGQVFESNEGRVKLDSRVPGDGTKWYVADWVEIQGRAGSWWYGDSTIEPGCLLEKVAS